MPRPKKADHESSIKKHIMVYVDKLESEIATMTAKAAELKRLFLDSFSSGKSKGKAVKAKKGKRKGRRSPEQLAAVAKEITAALKAAGSEGMRKADIESKFSTGSNVKKFLTDNGVGFSVKGKTAKARYFPK